MATTLDALKKDEKVFINASMHINGRIIASQDYVMQLQNVSQVKIGPIPKTQLPFKTLLVLGVAALISFYIKNAFFIILGIALLCVAGYLIYSNYSQTKYYGMTFELNSGNIYSFVSDDKPFLQDLLSRIQGIMNDPSQSNQVYNVHFGSGSINSDSNVYNSGKEA